MEKEEKLTQVESLTELIKIAFEEIRRLRADQKEIQYKLDSAITNITGIAMQQFEVLQNQRKG